MDPSSTSNSAEQPPLTRATLLYVLCAAINSCNLGYDIGVSTDASRLIQDDMGLTDVQREFFVGSINFWAILGALLTSFVTDGYGRRCTFVVAAVWFLLGVIIMSAATSFTVLMTGRIFVGLGVGVGLAVRCNSFVLSLGFPHAIALQIDPLYIAEISPPQYRGRLVTYSEVALNVGIVLGFASGLVTTQQWRPMLLAGALLPLVMIALVATGVMPESPRWLVHKHGRTEQAKSIIQSVHGPTADVGKILEEMERSIKREEVAKNAVSWGIIQRPAFRRMLIVGAGTALAQQATGIDGIQYYLLDVIDKSNLGSETREGIVLILLGLVKLVFIFVGGRMFDTSGRRPLLFASLIGMSLSLFMISLAFFANAEKLSSAATIAGLGLYLAFFSIGMGPGAWLIPSEVFSMSIRGKAMSIATVMNRLTATAVATTVVSTSNRIGWSGFFLLLGLVCLVVLAFLYVYLPETKGRSLEDMATFFAEITGDDSILQAEQQVRLGIELGPVAETTKEASENEII